MARSLIPTGIVGAYRAKRVNAATTTPQAAGALVDATSSTAVGAPGAVTITLTAATRPASEGGTTLNQLRNGMLLAITDGTGTAEVVTVTSFAFTNAAQTTATVTATFANTHTGPYNVRSLTGCDLGTVVVTAAGTAATLTLYDGNPALTTGHGAGTIIATVPTAAGVGSFMFACETVYGLYYSYTGTPGDLCLHYRPHGM